MYIHISDQHRLSVHVTQQSKCMTSHVIVFYHMEYILIRRTNPTPTYVTIACSQ